MFERPILRDHSGGFVELEPLSARHSQDNQPVVMAPRGRTIGRAITAVAIIGSAAMGLRYDHPVLGFVCSAAALFIVALVAFGNSILDDTIELV